MDSNASIATENFIKAIFKNEHTNHADTKSGTIARELGITHAAATDMARKLATRQLVDYQKYKALKLTESGRELAVLVLRRHRLWETFLSRVLGLDLHQVHKEAEALEHATSDFLLDQIDAYLGYPKFDPHGDPIPDKNGVVDDSLAQIAVSNAEVNMAYQVCRLNSSDEEFFEFCRSNRIVLGTPVVVRKHYPKNKMTEVEIGDTKLLLNREFADAILVELVNEEPCGIKKG